MLSSIVLVACEDKVDEERQPPPRIFFRDLSNAGPDTINVKANDTISKGSVIGIRVSVQANAFSPPLERIAIGYQSFGATNGEPLPAEQVSDSLYDAASGQIQFAEEAVRRSFNIWIPVDTSVATNAEAEFNLTAVDRASQETAASLSFIAGE